MTRKGIVVSLVGVASIVAVSALQGAAFEHGKRGHRGGGKGSLWLLARAAGLDRSQIATAFENDSNLKTARSELRSAREALTTCLVSGNSCSSQISAYANARQSLAQEEMTVWGNLFQGAPDTTRAATILEQLKQLQAQRKQIFRQVFGFATSSSGAQSSSKAPTATTVGPTAATSSAPVIADALRTPPGIRLPGSARDSQMACDDGDDSSDDSGSDDSQAVDSEA
jgi:hypothetical protein